MSVRLHSSLRPALPLLLVENFFYVFPSYYNSMHEKEERNQETNNSTHKTELTNRASANRTTTFLSPTDHGDAHHTYEEPPTFGAFVKPEYRGGPPGFVHPT